MSILQAGFSLAGIALGCVLVVADKRKPTEIELTKMAGQNPDGAGIAWREGDTIRWRKGLTLEEIKPLNEQAPMPYVLHFRIGTCGGKIPEMTHPFPVEREVGLSLDGSTKGSVLFHNGHWSPYKERGLDHAIKNKVRVPAGKWSDTRVMAWLTHLHGPGILEFIDEKVILFSPTKIEIFHPDGWFRIQDLLVSNRIWEHFFVRDDNDEAWDYMYQPHNSHRQVCRLGNCTKDTLGASWYCEEHQPPCREKTCSQPRIGGTEYCREHQLSCIAVLCQKAREPGEMYCRSHVPVRSDNKKTEPLRLTAPRENPADDAHDRVLPAILEDPVLQEQRKWACSFNVKRLSGHVM